MFGSWSWKNRFGYSSSSASLSNSPDLVKLYGGDKFPFVLSLPSTILALMEYASIRIDTTLTAKENTVSFDFIGQMIFYRFIKI